MRAAVKQHLLWMHLGLAPWRARRLWLGLLLLLYGVLIGLHLTPVPAGSDSGGYFNGARLLATGELTAPARDIPEAGGLPPRALAPLGFNVSVDGTRLIPNYPVGLSLQYAPAGRLFGWWWGPWLVSVALSLAAVVACFACLTALGVRAPLAFAGAVAFAASPLVLAMSFTPMSDVAAAAWWTFAFWAALRAEHGRSWALAAGAAFGMAVLTRPTTLVLAPALALACARPGVLARVVVGGAPFALFLAWYNHRQFGGALETGYGGIFTAFSSQHLQASLRNYALTFPAVFPLALAAAPAAFALPWRHRRRAWAAVLLGAVTLPVFYAFYDMTGEVWWYLRFVLPVFPLLAALALAGLQRLLARRGVAGGRVRVDCAAAAVLVVSLAAAGFWIREKRILRAAVDLRPYAESAAWANGNLPSGAVVLCMQASSSLFFSTPFAVLRWDALADEDAARVVRALERSGRPFFALLQDHETSIALDQRFRGEWRPIRRFRHLGLWEFVPSRPVREAEDHALPPGVSDAPGGPGRGRAGEG